MSDCSLCGGKIGETCLQKLGGTIYCEACYDRYFAPKQNMFMEGIVWVLLFAATIKLFKVGILIWGFVVG